METKEYRIMLIKLHIYAANYLKCLSRYNINFEIWYHNVLKTLERVYGQESRELLMFKSIKFSPKAVLKDDLELCRQIYSDGLEESVQLLKECISNISIEENNSNIVSDVQEYLKALSLTVKEKENIINELTEANGFLDNRNKHEQPWKWETKINNIVKILNQIIKSNSQTEGSK